MDLDRDVGPYLDLLPPAPVSHLPAFMDASAAGMFRARAHSSAMPCSAAATVLAVGALTTRQPHCRGIDWGGRHLDWDPVLFATAFTTKPPYYGQIKGAVNDGGIVRAPPEPEDCEGMA